MRIEWGEIFVDLAGHIAWPISILLVVWLLKGSLRQLLDPKNVEQIEAGPSSVKLTTRKIDSGLDSVKQSMSPSAPGTDQTGPLGVASLKGFAEIAAIDPAAATLASAARFESVLRRRMEGVHREIPQSSQGRDRLQPMGSLIREAQEVGVLNTKQANAATQLNIMRNQIVHQYADVEMSELQAIEFCRLSAELERAIDD
ncbi:hypothetical protein [Corynebacterium tuscaniense]|uniref:hypothetical protein n=1 Tax=Corynebacterium tuscaniense TaxID=302449 RepID=UPI00050FCBD2|nr:hypothetical protein [Corynebacterium tuscaniense]KAA8732673.1 hypothetical protein F4V54_09090 [Corynebacterium tuscaniense]KGF22083.1 hypothetical protein HMPREF2129_08180 [Corynebacterium tuscaniense DNF00037]